MAIDLLAEYQQTLHGAPLGDRRSIDGQFIGALSFFCEQSAEGIAAWRKAVAGMQRAVERAEQRRLRLAAYREANDIRAQYRDLTDPDHGRLTHIDGRA